jgi:hypothetical protein
MASNATVTDRVNNVQGSFIVGKFYTSVNILSIFINCIVCCAFIILKKKKLWSKEIFNFYFLFAFLIATTVLNDLVKISMREFTGVGGSWCTIYAVIVVFLEITRLWLILFLSLESYLIVRVDPTIHSQSLTSCYRMYFYRKRRLRSICLFILLACNVHMLCIHIYPGFGGPSCSIDSKDRWVRFYVYHWLTVFSTISCTCASLNLIWYLRAILIQSGNRDKIKHLRTLVTIPTVAMIWNTPLVVFQIIFYTNFIPSIIIKIIGLSIGFVYSIAIVIQNRNIRIAVCDVLTLFVSCCNTRRVLENETHDSMHYEVIEGDTLHKPLTSDFTNDS